MCTNLTYVNGGVKVSEKIGQKIRALRKAKHLSQEQLGDLLDLKRSTISNWEIGRRSPHITELQRISEKLGVSLEYFGIHNGSETLDLIARAKTLFLDENIPESEKIKVYQEVMKLYLTISDK